MISLNVKNCQLLKDFRISKNVKAKDIAIHINISNAYISKLLKGDYKTIEEIVLLRIIKYITDNETEQNEIFNNIKNMAEKQTLSQQAKEKITELELYIKDFQKVLNSMDDNISINEQMKETLIQQAKENINIYKKVIHDLIDNILLPE